MKESMDVQLSAVELPFRPKVCRGLSPTTPPLPLEHEGAFGLCPSVIKNSFQTQSASQISWLEECVTIEGLNRHISLGPAVQIFVS